MRWFFKRRGCLVPPKPLESYENWLFQKIEPIINHEEMSDKEKIDFLKKIVENFDPLEY